MQVSIISQIILWPLLLAQYNPSFFHAYTTKQEYNIDEFHKKIDLDNGTLDQNGDDISFIFVKTKLDAGKYEVEISDGPGDLYEINGTDIYITFREYYGYAGYGDEGILIVGGSTYSSTFYKIGD